MRLLLTSTVLAFAGLAGAQGTSPATPSPTAPATPAPAADFAAAKTRLGASLQKASQQADTAFTVKWGPDKKKKGGDDPFARMLGAMTSGEAKGSWHQDLVHVAFAGDEDDELLLAGRTTLAKDGTRDWCLRRGRFADGNTLSFVPDVPALLRQLASWDLAVTQRAVGSLDDRPVEVITVTLSADQVAEAVWAGLLPEAVTQASGIGGARVFRLAAGAGGGARPPADAPTTTLDLAVHLDPATNVIHRLHFRGWTKEDAGGPRLAAAGVMVVQGGRVAGAGGDDEEEEEDDKAEQAAKDAPLTYENGLPVRPRKKTSVCDFVVNLREHGQHASPALDAVAKKLLGR